MMKILATAVAFFMLAGCAGQSISDGGSNLALMYLTMKGTAEIIDNEAERAEVVRRIATEIRQYATDETYLTVDLLIAKIDSEVPWHRLDAADTMLIQGLIEELRTRLVEKLGEDVLPENLRLSVETVTGWVILAARP